jgi:hypothetical protein
MRYRLGYQKVNRKQYQIIAQKNKGENHEEKDGIGFERKGVGTWDK